MKLQLFGGLNQTITKLSPKKVVECNGYAREVKYEHKNNTITLKNRSTAEGKLHGLICSYQ